jgi:hypothetical protein
MPYSVHSRAVLALHMSESVFRVRCVAHDSHLVTKSALPNSCARYHFHNPEEHASNISELRNVPPGDEPSICEHNRIQHPSLHLLTPVCVCTSSSFH